MEIISFINMKGGVGKTTSVVEIGTILARFHNKKVLVIDIDPQTNATFSLIGLEEWDRVKDSATMADVLGIGRNFSSRNDEYDINNAVIEDAGGVEGLDLIPSHIELTFLDLDLSSETGRENILSRNIRNLTKEYDFVLIDCPPNLTLAPQNALMVSNFIIVPVTPEFFASIGLPLLINRVDQLKAKLVGCSVEILGVLFTKVKTRTNDHSQHLVDVRKTCHDDLGIDTFQTVIPDTVHISEAATQNQPATLYNPNANGVTAYKNLVTELLYKLEDN